MYWSEFITIAVAHLLAVASPGPDFAVVLKQSVTGGTRQGILTSLGVGAGILIHVSYCLLGMSILFAQSDMLLTAMKYLAASYLAYLGVQTISASSRHRPAREKGPGRCPAPRLLPDSPAGGSRARGARSRPLDRSAHELHGSGLPDLAPPRSGLP